MFQVGSRRDSLAGAGAGARPQGNPGPGAGGGGQPALARPDPPPGGTFPLRGKRIHRHYFVGSFAEPDLVDSKLIGLLHPSYLKFEVFFKK